MTRKIQLPTLRKELMLQFKRVAKTPKILTIKNNGTYADGRIVSLKILINTKVFFGSSAYLFIVLNAFLMMYFVSFVSLSFSQRLHN